jgi:hypothetical protein
MQQCRSAAQEQVTPQLCTHKLLRIQLLVTPQLTHNVMRAGAARHPSQPFKAVTAPGLLSCAPGVDNTIPELGNTIARHHPERRQ